MMPSLDMDATGVMKATLRARDKARWLAVSALLNVFVATGLALTAVDNTALISEAVSGLLLVYVVGYEVVPTRGWRCLAAIGALIPTVRLTALSPLPLISSYKPESPLCGAGRLISSNADGIHSVRALHFPLSHSFSHTNLKSPCAEQAERLCAAQQVRLTSTFLPCHSLSHTNLKSPCAEQILQDGDEPT